VTEHAPVAGVSNIESADASAADRVHIKITGNLDMLVSFCSQTCCKDRLKLAEYTNHVVSRLLQLHAIQPYVHVSSVNDFTRSACMVYYLIAFFRLGLLQIKLQRW